jgi:hypothetical protein
MSTKHVQHLCQIMCSIITDKIRRHPCVSNVCAPPPLTPPPNTTNKESLGKKHTAKRNKQRTRTNKQKRRARSKAQRDKGGAKQSTKRPRRRTKRSRTRARRKAQRDQEGGREAKHKETKTEGAKQSTKRPRRRARSKAQRDQDGGREAKHKETKKEGAKQSTKRPRRRSMARSKALRDQEGGRRAPRMIHLMFVRPYCCICFPNIVPMLLFSRGNYIVVVCFPIGRHCPQAAIGPIRSRTSSKPETTTTMECTCSYVWPTWMGHNPNWTTWHCVMLCSHACYCVFETFRVICSEPQIKA